MRVSYSRLLFSLGLLLSSIPILKWDELNPTERGEKIFSELSPSLPPGCEDFEVIKGEPLRAETDLLIFAVHHTNCREAKLLCTEGLFAAKKIAPKDTIILLEKYSYEQTIMCFEEGFQKLSNICRGWNVEVAKLNEINSWYYKDHGLEIIMQELQEVKQDDAIDYLTNYIEIQKNRVKAAKNDYKNFMEEFGKNIPNLYSIRWANMKLAEFMLIMTQNIACRVINKRELLDNIWNELGDQRNMYINKINAYMENIENFIVRPNNAMIKSIREAKKEKNKTIAVYGGRLHINIHRLSQEQTKKNQRHKQAIQDLYHRLNESPGANTYAVLSCTR